MDLRWRPLWAGSWLRWSLVRRCRMMWSLLGCHGLQALKAHCRISVLDHAVLVLSMAWFVQALKTPWKFENCWISVKSPWIFHRSPWMFLKAPWIKITFVLKKKNMFCAKEWLKAQQYKNFPWWTWKVFSYDLGVPGMVHFPLFDVPF